MATNLNGGFYDYADKTTPVNFYKQAANKKTKQTVVKAGQVLKAGTFLQSDAAGKLIAHAGSTAKIAGVTMYDVNALAADTEVEVWIEASFWASALVWSVNILTDTITLFDGTTIPVTVYDSLAGASKLLQQKFTEGSAFVELGFLTLGEIANG